MKKENQRSVIFAILFTVLFCVIIFFIVLSIIYTSLEFVFGFIGTFATAMFGLWQFNKTKKLEIEARLFQNKADAYKDIIRMLFDLFRSEKGYSAKKSEDELVNEIFSIREKLTVWASSEVIIAFAELEHPNTEEKSPEELSLILIRKLAKIYAAIRKDLGHSDKPGTELEIALGHMAGPDKAILKDMLKKNP